MLKGNDEIIAVLSEIKEYCNKNKCFLQTDYFKLEGMISKITDNIDLLDKEDKLFLENELSDSNEIYRIYMLSFLMNFYKKNDYIKSILELLLYSKTLSVDNKFFVVSQLNYFISTNSDFASDEIIKLQSEVYNEIIKEYKGQFDDLKLIPKEDRNDKFIIVFASQILNINHKPTEIALKLCYLLQESLKKKVVLIDTNELLSNKGLIPFNKMVEANKDNKSNEISYNNVNIPFYKVEKLTPDKEEYSDIIRIVKEYKPYLIFSIGDKCIINDICSELVDSITIALGENILLTGSDSIIFYDKCTMMNDKTILFENFSYILNDENDSEFCKFYNDIILKRI